MRGSAVVQAGIGSLNEQQLLAVSERFVGRNDHTLSLA